MRAVATVYPDHRSFIAVGGGVRWRSSKRLSPIRGEPLDVVGLNAVTEGMAHHLVTHHPGMPRGSQAQHAWFAARGLVNAPHHPEIIVEHRTRAAACDSAKSEIQFL